MNMAASGLAVRLDAIRRRIRAGRGAVAAGNDIDLSELGDEIREVSRALRAAPLQIDRRAVADDLENILTDLNRLRQELDNLHTARGGRVSADDGEDG